ncbi:MAG: LysR family transcriptional regulator [Gaiellaceae bacterium]
MHPQLEAFVEVVRAGSVTRAALQLHLTQPALTARLNALERSVGTPLLVRRRSGVKPTEAGRAFLPYAERALQAVADGRLLLADLERGAAGHLALGASPAVSTYTLPTILKRFSESHPGVQVTLRTGHSEEMLELVKRDEVAVGLLRAFNDPEIEQFVLYEDELVLVVHPKHPVAERVQLAELADEQFVMFDPASSYHELTSSIFLEAGIVPRGVMEVDNTDSVKKMVELGLGVAFLPHVSVADEVRSKRLRIVALTDRTPPRRPIVAVRRRDAGEPTGVTAAFLSLLRELQPELQAAASATA